MDASALTDAGSMPCFLKPSRTCCSRTKGSTPLRQPTPATTALGTSLSTWQGPAATRLRSIARALSLTVIHILYSPGSVQQPLGTPDDQSPNSWKNPTFPPSRSLADTCRAASRSVRASPLEAANTSTAKSPFTSVAVVITGTAPMHPLIRSARALAPPTWPDRIGIEKRPPSSTTTTGGSVILSFINGAMARTAIPAAPTNTMALCSRNMVPVHWLRDMSRHLMRPSTSPAPQYVSRKRPGTNAVHSSAPLFNLPASWQHSLVPLAVKLVILIFNPLLLYP